MMKKIDSVLSLLLTIILMGVFVSCERDKEVMLTAVSITNEQITPTYKSATISSTISSEATIRDVFVQYTVTKDFAEYDEVPMQEKDGIYTAELIDLQDNTTYYYRYAASNRHSAIVLQKIQQFATLQPTVPAIRLDSILTVWDSYAQVQVALEFDGGASVTDMGVCWGTQANPTIEDIHKSTKDTVAVLDIPSLQSNTQYYIRAYAVNKVGVAYSEELVFTTYALPEVRTEDVSDIQVNSALLSATLVFDGNDTATIKGFCWSDKSEPTIEGDHIAVDTICAHYTYVLSELLPATEYHVRAYAQNKIGVAYGEEKIFTTSKEIVSPTVTTAAITQITETSALAGGNVTSDGGASVTERGVVYATTQNPTTHNTKVTSGTGSGSFTCNLIDLQPNTTYYVCAYAINEKGTAYGEEVSFTTNKQIVLPSVTTDTVTQITETNAVAGGNVTSDGGASVTERGVVYATTQNPTTNNTKVTSGIGTGSFTCNLTDLQPNTKYYVRAYAVNSQGTAYGEEVSFTTKVEVVDNPSSNLRAMPFSVSESKQVYFSKGNLQYTQSTNTWSFASAQYEVIGTDNVTGGSALSDPTEGDYKSGTALADKIDLFGWSTGATHFGVSTSTDDNDYSGSFVDWGTNKIGNDAPNTWRTLSYDEWEYLLNNRPNASSLCGVAQVNGVNGLIFLPDNWTCPAGITFKSGFNSSDAVDYYAAYQTFTANQWFKLESAGAVFLPAAGSRFGSSVAYVQYYGNYWSATEYNSSDARFLYFNAETYWYDNSYRKFGLSVRLVKDIQHETVIMLPYVITSSVIQITKTSAVAGGNVTSNGGAEVTERGVVYSLSAHPSISDLSSTNVRSGSGTGAFTCNLSNLQAGTTYYVCAYAINNKGTAYGDEVSFTTAVPITLATVTTASITNITETTAKAGGTVTNDGNAAVTERGVCISTVSNPTTSNTKISAGLGTGSFTCNLTGLQANTTYYVRAYAVNSKGTAYGEQVSFTTSKTVVLPSVTTSTVTQITQTTAVAGGNVTSDGNASVTERGVVYGKSPNPTISNLTNTIRPCGSGMGEFTYNMTDLQPSTTYYVRAYATNEKGTAYGDEVSFTTKEQAYPSDGTENGYAYVDLGLSVKWATMNVGASKAEDYGSYFAWGETTTKSTYDWSTYKYCNGDYDLLTKYCNKSSYGNNGFTDNKTQLELSDDAARANWGGSWRMPTDAEWTELREQCTWTWTTQNGKNGYKVTSKSNGNSIFLPAAGCRYDSSRNSAGINGNYWSSSLCMGIPYYAWSVYFYSGYVGRNYNCRYDGQSVRPVCP